MNATLDGVRSANRGLDALTHRVEAGMANLMDAYLTNAAEQQRNDSSTRVSRLLAPAGQLLISLPTAVGA